jgi:putative flippase GtrA
MVTAFALARWLVFPPSGRSTISELSWFTFVNLLAVAQVWLVSVGLAEFLFPRVGFGWHADTIAHVIGVSIPAVTSYFGHKYLSFAKRRH